MTDVRSESRLGMVNLTVKLTLQCMPTLTVTIAGAGWIFVAFFLASLKWRVRGTWHARTIHTYAT